MYSLQSFRCPLRSAFFSQQLFIESVQTINILEAFTKASTIFVPLFAKLVFSDVGLPLPSFTFCLLLIVHPEVQGTDMGFVNILPVLTELRRSQCLPSETISSLIISVKCISHFIPLVCAQHGRDQMLKIRNVEN